MPPTDTPEFIALLDRYERVLIRYARSITGDLDSARDVVQETFIKVAQMQTRSAERGARKEPPGTEDRDGGDRLLPRSAFRAPRLEAWLFTVTRNGALDHQRKHSRIIPMTLPDDRACAAPGPDATLEQRENATVIFGMLDALSANQREVIRLKFQNDLSYREIAGVTGLTVTNVGFLIHAGLKKLRELLRAQPTFDFETALRTAP